MSRQTESAFLRVYKEYVDFYKEKKYEKSLELLLQFDLKNHFTKHAVYIDFVLRSASHAATMAPNTQYTVAVANAFNVVLTAIAERDAYDQYFSTLNCSFFEMFLPFLSKLSPSTFDLSEWLLAINTKLFKVLTNAKIVDDAASSIRKSIYLRLTQLLLIFVNAEAHRATLSNGRWQFNASRQFLASCQQFHLYQGGNEIGQYNTCFGLLSKFLDVLSLETANGVQANAMQQYLKELKSITKSKSVRATLVQDNYITLARIIKACESLFIKSAQLDPIKVASYFDVLNVISFGCSQVKTEKKFCSDCDLSGIHCCHETTTIAFEMYLTLLDKQFNEEIVEAFVYMVRINFCAISKLKCSKALNKQREAVRMITNLKEKCNTKEKSTFLIPVLCGILKYYHRIELLDGTKYMDEIYLLNYLLNAYNIAEKIDDMMNIGYLLLAKRLAVTTNHNVTVDLVAYTMIKQQKERNLVKTPYDYFESVKKESLYGLELPKEFNLNKLTFEFLRVGFKYNVMAAELKNKIIHQLIMSASPKDTSALRFALYIQSMKMDKITSDRIDKLAGKLCHKSKDDLSLALHLATIKYLRFNNETTEIEEKNQSLSISEALSENNLTSERNIFRIYTLDFEKDRIDTLRDIKKRFIDFTDFYLGKSSDERNTFDDEKEFLLRELKVVANQFIVRGYFDDGMDLYIALSKLAKELNDEFGMIDACSFFAEHRSNCISKVPEKELNAIIEDCYVIAMTKLKELTKLSARKQNQVCFFILNLVLFYHEAKGDNKFKIHTILKFIFKTIGGIGNKEMETSMDAVVGERPVDDKTSPKIQNEAVRIKFYSVLFTIVTKYGAKSTFLPTKFVDFALNHVKKYLSVYYDSTAAVPIMLFNMIPEMILWLEGRYEFCQEYPSLLSTLVKFSIRSGYALRTVSNMTVMLRAEILDEKFSMCKMRFKALENLMVTEGLTAEENRKYEDETPSAVGLNARLCEPVREHASKTSPMKCLSPGSIRVRSTTTYVNKFLLKHPANCDCGVCFNIHNKLQMFCVAVAYARYVYLNDDEFNVAAKSSVFDELFEYWENCRNTKQFPKTELYYVISARMLSYYAHFHWKCKKNYKFAKELLARALKGLERVKHDTTTMKNDFNHQINMMASEIESPIMDVTPSEVIWGGNIFMSRRAKPDDNPSLEAQVKLPQKKTKSTVNGRVNLMDLLELVNNEPQKTGGFQIHDDEAEFGATSTPSAKRTTRRAKATADKTPARAANSQEYSKTPRVNPSAAIDLVSEPTPKTRRGQRYLPAPVIEIDLTSPPEITATSSAEKTPSDQNTPTNGASLAKNQVIAPKKPKCLASKDARKATNTNQTYVSTDK